MLNITSEKHFRLRIHIFHSNIALLRPMYIRIFFLCTVLVRSDGLCSKDDSTSVLQSKADVQRTQLHPTNSTIVSRIAIYTANFGGYDYITDNPIADVPEGVHAFYFLDDATLKKNQEVLHKWEQQGWEIVPYKLLPGNEVMDQERLTSRELKFTPPDWLLHGSWDWLVYYDSHYFVNATLLFPFLQQNNHVALILHDYCYANPPCCGEGNGFKCFEHDMDFLFNKPPGPRKIREVRDKMMEWRKTVEKRIENKTLTLPHYFDMHLLMRNLKHPKADRVAAAFEKVFAKVHELKRDQSLVPVYLHDFHITEVYAASLEDLEDRLQWRGTRWHTRVGLALDPHIF